MLAHVFIEYTYLLLLGWLLLLGIHTGAWLSTHFTWDCKNTNNNNKNNNNNNNIGELKSFSQSTVKVDGIWL